MVIPAHQAQNAQDLFVGWHLITNLAAEQRVFLQLALLLVQDEPDVRGLRVVRIVPLVFAVSRQSLLHNSIIWEFYSLRNCRY